MQRPGQTVLLLLGGLGVVMIALLFLTSLDPGVSGPLPHGCQGEVSCGAKSLWRDPERVRRFAAVFRS